MLKRTLTAAVEKRLKKLQANYTSVDKARQTAHCEIDEFYGQLIACLHQRQAAMKSQYDAIWQRERRQLDLVLSQCEQQALELENTAKAFDHFHANFDPRKDSNVNLQSASLFSGTFAHLQHQMDKPASFYQVKEFQQSHFRSSSSD